MRPARRYRAYLSQLNSTYIHMKNPWVPAFFSFAFPGFGSLLQNRLLKAFSLISWEVFINSKAHINLGIFYSMFGKFEKAKEVLDERWLLLYAGIYIYSIWESYRTTVDLNKQCLLADMEDSPITPFALENFDLNFLDKREPKIAFFWSVIVPGIGHLYVHKVLTAFVMFSLTVTILYFSHLPQAMMLTFIGDSKKALSIINIQWALYFPSIYLFIIYDAYTSAIELNKLFEKELSLFLRKNFQPKTFKFPV